mmetsp:Transcript_10269/g.25861  ORF Transcript_10269/g.25861 Transcript_10269/m.25861 type:complete len:377 (-) Transcript_10269:7-1137(-)
MPVCSRDAPSSPASSLAACVPIAWAATFFAAFVVAMVANGLVTTGYLVPLTNKVLSDAHPVYLTPMSWAFAVWGLIYALLAVFAIVQLIPTSIKDPVFAPLRPLATLAMFLNVVWLFTFAYQYFWISLVVISFYLIVLYKLVALVDTNLITALARIRSPGKWRMIIAQLAFSANASWVTVATLLNLQVTLLEEGWASTEEFSTGLIAIAIVVACVASHIRADLAWAAVAAWALLAIGANQMPGVGWGCLSEICAACESDDQRICTNGRDSPLGWQQSCAGFDNSTADSDCVLAKSLTIVDLTITGTALVFIFFATGVVNGIFKAIMYTREAAADLELSPSSPSDASVELAVGSAGPAGSPPAASPSAGKAGSAASA